MNGDYKLSLAVQAFRINTAPSPAQAEVTLSAKLLDADGNVVDAKVFSTTAPAQNAGHRGGRGEGTGQGVSAKRRPASSPGASPQSTPRRRVEKTGPAELTPPEERWPGGNDGTSNDGAGATGGRPPPIPRRRRSRRLTDGLTPAAAINVCGDHGVYAPVTIGAVFISTRRFGDDCGQF